MRAGGLAPTDIQTLLIWMGSRYPQETIIRTFQSLDAFRDKNMTQLEAGTAREFDFAYGVLSLHPILWLLSIYPKYLRFRQYHLRS
jgi:hypothetical protein